LKKKITDIIRVDSSLSTPIYRQIVLSVCECIEKGKLNRNDLLPSVNSIAETFSLSRGSVFTAYNDLRSSGIIDSIPGKGYVIASTILRQNRNIFLLFATLNERTTALYHSITRHLGMESRIDLYFHGNDAQAMERFIRNDAPRYNTFVIVPAVDGDATAALSGLNQKHLFLLDECHRDYSATYNGVFRNREKEIGQVFAQFAKHLSKYRRLYLVLSRTEGEVNSISAFRKLAKKASVDCDVVYELAQNNIRKGDAYIIYDDQWLVNLVKWAEAVGFKVGKDVGIISYGDSVLKEAVAKGITTFATDIEYMGKNMAEMICSGGGSVLEAPVVINDRNSF